MMGKIKSLCVKYRELIVYVIVGGLTTLVSWAAKFAWNFIFYGGTAYPTELQAVILSTVEWVAGVAFAYPTNRRFVFQSKDPEIFKECLKFVLSRVSTYLLSVGLNVLLTWLGVNVYVTTIVAAVAVVIANYVISKLLVFRKKEA
ncbi:MAG: GtrA family protein [Eubacteriales bacterium]|nr:GtrA family protein [Eubacteriales bacterium]